MITEKTIIECAKRNFGNTTFNSLCKKLQTNTPLSNHQKQLDSFLNEACKKFDLSKKEITKVKWKDIQKFHSQTKRQFHKQKRD